MEASVDNIIIAVCAAYVHSTSNPGDNMIDMQYSGKAFGVTSTEYHMIVLVN